MTVENVWPANSALFIYLSTHCVLTVKQLDRNRYSQLTRWCRGNASALSTRGPGFHSGLRHEFLCLSFCFVVVVVLLFCPKTHYLSLNIAISFTMVIYLVYQIYCKNCDRLKGYKDIDLASLRYKNCNKSNCRKLVVLFIKTLSVLMVHVLSCNYDFTWNKSMFNKTYHISLILL